MFGYPAISNSMPISLGMINSEPMQPIGRKPVNYDDLVRMTLGGLQYSPIDPSNQSQALLDQYLQNNRRQKIGYVFRPEYQGNI